MLSVVITDSLQATTQIHPNALVLITTLILLVLLIQKDISGSIRGARAKRLSQALDIAIVPLLVIFIANAIAMVAAVVR
jgi:hypothetical protein